MLQLILTALVFVFIFSALVLIHEFGHFFVARKNGIKVEEFGFGLPPRIWGFKKGETLYSLNAIPFGGFVRLLGEDNSDTEAAKNPRSFASKPIRVRIMVVLAGVFMNFLLAFVLLTIGFIFGIQPLIVSGDDLINALQNGTIQTQQGIIVKEIKDKSPAQIGGLQVNDTILNINGRTILSPDQLQKVIQTPEKTPVVIQILRNGEKKSLQLMPQSKENLGFSTYELIVLPRLQVYESGFTTPAFQAPIPGDILLKINGENIYSINDYHSVLRKAVKLQLTVLRDDKILELTLPVSQNFRTVVSHVLPGSPAEKSGFQAGDLVVGVEDGDIHSITVPQDLINVTKKSAGKKLTYNVIRDRAPLRIDVIPEKNGTIGISLAELISYENNRLALFNKDVPMSVLKIKNISYPVWIAPLKAFDESVRLGGLTIQMFGNVIHSFVTRLTIPEGVSGPIGIAQMTYTFVQEGVLSLLRFMALLSLSLAIINVLPFPALDGGRLLFIVIEMLLGRRLSPRYESFIHAAGFLILMILILAVSYSDVLRIL